MSTGFEIVVSDRATAADRSELEDRLYAFNEERTGLGRRLVEAAEDEARARRCDTVVVTSHEFQAPSFYAGLGYHVVGATKDTPRGYRELPFQKPLSRDA